MATKKETLEMLARGEGCLGKAADDEPVFVLRAHDKTFAEMIFIWAMLQRLIGSTAHDKIGSAEQIAHEGRQWQARTGRAKVAD
jgi:hypothetical protein